MADKIVGHKSFADGHGGFRHEPLLESEVRKLLLQADESKAKRAADMPDEKAAIRAMFDAWLRLRELGWREAIYCPKDGSLFKAIEPGSTGIHDCSYWGEWPDGDWHVHDDNDNTWPSRPILFKVDK